MADDELPNAARGKSIEAVVGGIAAAVQLVAGTLNPILGAFLAPLAPAAQLGAWYYVERSRRRSQTFDAAFCVGAGCDVLELVQKANESERPAIGDVVLEGFRAMSDAVDDAVVPALGRLSAAYAKEGLRPDSFFRGVGRLLVELDAEDYRQLCCVISAAAGLPTHFTLVTGVVSQRHSPVRGLGYKPGGSGDNADWQPLPGCSDLPRWRRIFHLLRTHGIAEEHDDFVRVGGTISRPNDIVFHTDVAKRVDEVLREPLPV